MKTRRMVPNRRTKTLDTNMTVRERVVELMREVRDAHVLQPERAAEILLELTSLQGIVNDEIRVADMDYAKVLLRELEANEKANRAKIKAETSPEYERKRVARDTKELIVEGIRSLKYFLRAERYDP